MAWPQTVGCYVRRQSSGYRPRYHSAMSSSSLGPSAPAAFRVRREWHDRPTFHLPAPLRSEFAAALAVSAGFGASCRTGRASSRLWVRVRSMPRIWAKSPRSRGDTRMKLADRRSTNPMGWLLALARRASMPFRPSATLSREAIDVGIPDEFRVDCCAPGLNTATSSRGEREK